ncbi:MAG: D-alanyl-D-alanine carboxypeptidase/D-alanyl-D-alanine-endopeptidase [Gemmatimonadota bacterium]
MSVARPMAGLLLLPILQGCAFVQGTFFAGPPEPSPLEMQRDSILGVSPLDGSLWGILAVDAATGDTLYSENAGRRFIPASNQKVLTVAAALDRLGPDYRWSTAIYSLAGAPDEGGAIYGDVVIPALGDPTLGPPFHPSGADAIDALVQRLQGAGVQRITGEILIDVSAWDSTSVPGSWMVEDLPLGYGASGGAFAVNRGTVDVNLYGGTVPGAPPIVTWSPRGSPDFIDSRVTTASSGDVAPVRGYWLPESGRLRLEGSVPAERVERASVSMRDPVMESARALRNRMLEAGMVVEGGVRILWDRDLPLRAGCASGYIESCAFALEVMRLESPPLSRVAQVMLETSDNWMAEQLLRTLGHEAEGVGSREAGFRAVAAYLTGLGIPEHDYHLADGSGLSVHNLLTPGTLVTVLHHMETGPHAAAFRDALAAPGEMDSSLEERLLGLRGRFVGKTGTLRHVNSLSGYLTRPSGISVYVAMMSNGGGLPADDIREAMDRLLIELDRTLP